MILRPELLLFLSFFFLVVENVFPMNDTSPTALGKLLNT